MGLGVGFGAQFFFLLKFRADSAGQDLSQRPLDPADRFLDHREAFIALMRMVAS